MMHGKIYTRESYTRMHSRMHSRERSQKVFRAGTNGEHAGARRDAHAYVYIYASGLRVLSPGAESFSPGAERFSPGAE